MKSCKYTNTGKNIQTPDKKCTILKQKLIKILFKEVCFKVWFEGTKGLTVSDWVRERVPRNGSRVRESSLTVLFATERRQAENSRVFRGAEGSWGCVECEQVRQVGWGWARYDFVADTAALELDSQLYRKPMKFGVQDWDQGALQTSRAAEFWTHCKVWMTDWGQPMRTEFP